MTHDELVELAAKWLSKKSSVVITEMVSCASEIPDAIGFKNYVSTLIECKTSRADFTADKKKWHRMHSVSGMGNYRYFLVPDKLISIHDLPIGWGLLECKNGRVYVTKKSEHHECNKNNEIVMLISALRRIGQVCPQGISVNAYTIETERKSTIGLKEIINERIKGE